MQRRTLLFGGLLPGVLFPRASSAESLEPQRLDAKLAAENAIFAMLASNTYHNWDRLRFPVELLGWRLVNQSGKSVNHATREHRLTGLAWDIFENAQLKTAVFSYRGTDSPLDYLSSSFMPWPLAVQYNQSRSDFRAFLNGRPPGRIVVTGHSLGGGLALGVSLRYGVDAVVFDPSPRVFDGWGDKHEPAKRLVVYQQGEVLAKVRQYWRKLLSTIPASDIYKTAFDFDGANAHRADKLALGMLELGATVEPTLRPVLQAISERAAA